ncbi:diguanylate cyclase [Salinibacterium sp. G-O1]|uniref:sensor domain-containing protein n=1 Tax=Salinibacterium sp. G-O1 TaxID=3046208 RepID=UPI0024B9852E|nr:diguanylate cyclase [Salinibacterium sp. G-O1]MDJ0336114.1 diguanylate cyclase [Salinibacterium sp. G-O1]
MTTDVSFEELYQNAACGQLLTDASGIITIVNETFLNWSGRSRAEVVGVQFRDLLTRGSLLFYETRYLPVLRLSGEVREVALELSKTDGSVLPILVNAIEVGGSTRIAVFDSTQRQDYERALLAARRAAEVSEARVRVLQDVSTAFFATSTEESLAEALLGIARDAFSATDGAVVLVDGAGSLRIVAGAHLLEPLVGVWVGRPNPTKPSAEQLTVVANLREAEALFPAAADILRSIRMEALTATPLIGANGSLGSLVLLFGRERTFDESTLELHRALARQASQVFERIQLQTELEQMALHDQLTGLANRNLLRERLSHALSQADRTGRAMSVIFLDLDGFKPVNDELGHRVGDAVLQIVAKRVHGVVREADIVGRFGGDEFLIVCEEADVDVANLIAERVVSAIAQPMTELPGDRTISASVGVACFMPGDLVPTGDALVRAADAAMYASKSAGSGRITAVRV